MRRVVLAVFALTVFLPSVALARTQFLCEVDLIVRDACCCPPKKAPPPTDTPTMQRECCKLLKQSSSTPPVAVERTTQAFSPVALPVVMDIDVVTPSFARRAIAPRAQAPPLERSLYSQHAALLL